MATAKQDLTDPRVQGPRRSKRDSNVHYLADQRSSSGTFPIELDLAAWLECYLADCEARGVTERTLEWYRDRGGRIVQMLDQWSVTEPDQLTRSVVSRLIGTLRKQERYGRPFQPQTILGYWQVGKGFATFLIAEGAIGGPNPFDQFGKPRVPQKSMWAPSRDECVALLRIPNRKTVQGLRDLTLLYLLLDTGLRVSAVTGIRLRDIDLAERRIWVLEKGQRERVLPFGVQALRWLRRYIAASRLTLEDPLFPGKAGRPISRKRVDEIIKECAGRAGITRGTVSAHDLRRAFAREFLRNGGDLESLRQLLGHTSYAMVKRYAELASDVVAEKHRKSSPGDHLVV
ncbi:MAG: tyrosine-type recombinase/integrase [Actinobacteria bacterium]|nr:tyrosine-type recombinase/integrase [Actinomycetota bacterium]